MVRPFIHRHTPHSAEHARHLSAHPLRFRPASAMLRCAIRRAPGRTLLLPGPDAPLDAQEEIADVPFLIVGEMNLFESILPEAGLELDEVGLVLVEHRD